jgi:hypothetical protein
MGEFVDSRRWHFVAHSWRDFVFVNTPRDTFLELRERERERERERKKVEIEFFARLAMS